MSSEYGAAGQWRDIRKIVVRREEKQAAVVAVRQRQIRIGFHAGIDHPHASNSYATPPTEIGVRVAEATRADSSATSLTGLIDSAG